MRKYQVVLASGCLAMLLSACGTYPYNPYVERAPRYGFGSTQNSPSPPPPSASGRTDYLDDYRQPRQAPYTQGDQDRRIQEQVRNSPAGRQQQVQPQPQPQPRQTPVPTSPSGQLPYGIPVPGKKGMVLSPYAKDSGYVDVTDIASGTEVRDPYTRKIFLVP